MNAFKLDFARLDRGLQGLARQRRDSESIKNCFGDLNALCTPSGCQLGALGAACEARQLRRRLTGLAESDRAYVHQKAVE